MNRVVEKIAQRARQAPKRIVLPESDDPRVLHAAEKIVKEGYGEIVLLGNPDKVSSIAKAEGVNLGGIEIIDHLNNPHREQCVQSLYEKRKDKGLTIDGANELLNHPVYYAGAMVGAGLADGMVAGSICPTRDTVRSAIFGVGLAEGNKTVSACSIMVTIVPEIGVDGAIIFADTGVLPRPTVEQLSDIAVASACSCKILLDTEPLVAMLSYSTKGSAAGREVDRIIAATELAKKKAPDLKIDGELQLDAAVVPSVAERKASGSQVAGRANTLIFPDLNAGNIGYKLVERLGKATALGPLLQGLAKPVNDLSRGCSVEDIVLISAITSLQAAGA